MFIGHFAIGLGAKTLAPRISLGTFLLAVQFLDLLWPTFLLFGLEHVRIEPGVTKLTPLNFISYPISHSLLMVCIWGLLFAFAYWLFRRNKKGAVILMLCVVSHWFLDLIVHRPDLPIFPGDSPKVGFSLWNSMAGTLLIEGIIFIVCLTAYLLFTQAKNLAGMFGFWALIIFLVLIYFSNLFGPLPESVTVIAWVGQLQWLFVIWAYWVDRNRIAKGPQR